MAAKPGPKNWDDIKMMLTLISITATLGFWNVFASANKQNIVAKEVEQPALPTPGGVTQALFTASPTPVFTGKILLGGKAPSQVVVTVQEKIAKNNQQPQQQPAPVTQTQSS